MQTWKSMGLDCKMVTWENRQCHKEPLEFNNKTQVTYDKWLNSRRLGLHRSKIKLFNSTKRSRKWN